MHPNSYDSWNDKLCIVCVLFVCCMYYLCIVFWMLFWILCQCATSMQSLSHRVLTYWKKEEQEDMCEL